MRALVKKSFQHRMLQVMAPVRLYNHIARCIKYDNLPVGLRQARGGSFYGPLYRGAQSNAHLFAPAVARKESCKVCSDTCGEEGQPAQIDFFK